MEATQAIKDKAEHLAATAYTSTDKLLEKFHNMGHMGCSRTVLIDREQGVAYKLALQEHTIDDNRKEWAVWPKLPASAQMITAQPLAISECGKVLAMELVGVTINKSTDDQDKIDKMREDFNNYLKLCLLESFTEAQAEDLMEDNHSANIAFRDDGSLVWIDFASI